MNRWSHSAWVMVVMLWGCSDGMPPMIQDGDGAAPATHAGDAPAADRDPCATPAPGCACGDAGAKSYCGLVYRISGSSVDCSPGYLTCEDDGGWSACIGDSIWDGG